MYLAASSGEIMQKRSSVEQEGEVTGIIETQTAKIPSGAYLTAAVGAMTASAILKAAGKDDWSQFIAHWAPAFLILGLYNKMVKQNGADSRSHKTRKLESSTA
jgi:hypothetical protein